MKRTVKIGLFVAALGLLAVCRTSRPKRYVLSRGMMV